MSEDAIKSMRRAVMVKQNLLVIGVEKQLKVL